MNELKPIILIATKGLLKTADGPNKENYLVDTSKCSKKDTRKKIINI